MKRLVLASSILFSLYFIVSCTKTNNVTTTVRDTTVVRDTVYLKSPLPPISGTWVGAYYLTGAPATDSFMYEFMLRPDSTLFTIGSGQSGTAGYASGKWALKGTAWTATIYSLNGVQPENQQNLSATYDSVSGTLKSGTWTDVGGNNKSGTFTLKRVP